MQRFTWNGAHGRRLPERPASVAAQARRRGAGQPRPSRLAQGRARGGVAVDAVYRAARKRRGATDEQAAHGRGVRLQRGHGPEVSGPSRSCRGRRRRRAGSRCARADRRAPSRGGPARGRGSPGGSARSGAPSCRRTTRGGRPATRCPAACGCTPTGVPAGRARVGSAIVCWPDSRNGCAGSWPPATSCSAARMGRGSADVDRPARRASSLSTGSARRAPSRA